MVLTNTKTVSFLPISLDQSFEQCLAFREDSFICSFGANPQNWPNPLNPVIYRDWLLYKLSKDPTSVLHAWTDGQVVGQLEIGRMKSFPEIGYLHFCYLIPEFRGTGLAKTLIEKAESFLIQKGHREAKLSVGPKNLRARRFYQKMGWIDAGPRPDRPEVNLMTKILNSGEKGGQLGPFLL